MISTRRVRVRFRVKRVLSDKGRNGLRMPMVVMSACCPFVLPRACVKVRKSRAENVVRHGRRIRSMARFEPPNLVDTVGVRRSGPICEDRLGSVDAEHRSSLR